MNRARAKTEVGAGWARLLDQCYDALDASGAPYSVYVVKEKFGTLRFYADGGDSAAHQVIAAAELESAVVCEDCGAPGVLRGRSWQRTQCTACAIAQDLRTGGP